MVVQIVVSQGKPNAIIPIGIRQCLKGPRRDGDGTVGGARFADIFNAVHIIVSVDASHHPSIVPVRAADSNRESGREGYQIGVTIDDDVPIS